MGKHNNDIIIPNLKIKFGKHRDTNGKYVKASKWLMDQYLKTGQVIYNFNDHGK